MFYPPPSLALYDSLDFAVLFARLVHVFPILRDCLCS